MDDTLAELSLRQLREAVAAYAARFDPALVPPGSLAEIVRDAGAMEKMLSTISLLAAARMASGAGQTVGATGRGAVQRLAAEAVARASGTSLGEARRAIEAGRAMAQQPDVAAAGLSGELSRQQASLIATATAANPGAASRLLDTARTGSLSELAEEAGRARSAMEDLEARRRTIQAGRSLRYWTDAYGAWFLQAKGLPEDGARIMAAIGPLAAQAFEAARKDGRREKAEAYAFDGLLALTSTGGAKKVGYDVMVRVDHPTLMRGYALEGETCEIPGFGTITPQAVLDIMETGDPFLKCIVTKGKDLVGVAHVGRRPNAYQRSALDWLFPTCAVEGCGARSPFLESDHREDWAKTHVTIFDLIDRMCANHHWLKTYLGWALVKGKGKRAFVPPDDPRHPNHAGGA